MAERTSDDPDGLGWIEPDESFPYRVPRAHPSIVNRVFKIPGFNCPAEDQSKKRRPPGKPLPPTPKRRGRRGYVEKPKREKSEPGLWGSG